METKQSDLLEITNSLRYSHANEGHTIFQAGDPGDLFYILVDGTCDVMVPILQLNLQPADYCIELANGGVIQK